MKSNLFPITIVDNFLEQPFDYLNLANSLEYKKTLDGRWPGLRTDNLSISHSLMMNRILSKIMSLFYDFRHININWRSESYFQKVSSKYNSGWIHTDDCLLSAIIYFCNEGLGTSLYKVKNITNHKRHINLDKKVLSFLDPDKIEEVEPYRIQNNEEYEQTISVDSKFNRLLLFEGKYSHGANNFIDVKEKGEDRLTLVIFILKMDAENFPIMRMDNA